MTYDELLALYAEHGAMDSDEQRTELENEFRKVEQAQIKIEKELGLTPVEMDGVTADLFCAALLKGFETNIKKTEGRKVFILVFESFQKGIRIGMNSKLN